MEREMDRQIGAVSAVMRALYWSVVVKRGVEALDLPVHLHSNPHHNPHKLWLVTKRTRSWIQEAKMSFLRRVAGLSL